MELLQFRQFFFGFIDDFLQFGFAGLFGFFEQGRGDIVNLDNTLVGKRGVGFFKGERGQRRLRNLDGFFAFGCGFFSSGGFLGRFFGSGVGFWLTGQFAFVVGDGDAFFFHPFKSAGGTAGALNIFDCFVFIHHILSGFFSFVNRGSLIPFLIHEDVISIIYFRIIAIPTFQ